MKTVLLTNDTVVVKSASLMTDGTTCVSAFDWTTFAIVLTVCFTICLLGIVIACFIRNVLLRRIELEQLRFNWEKESKAQADAGRKEKEAKSQPCSPQKPDPAELDRAFMLKICTCLRDSGGKIDTDALDKLLAFCKETSTSGDRN
ncbi:MAG: hypothetical protein J1E02_08875 [Coprobacter sp.]|nr:hypothetical protein [Coprobacter sp.]